MRSNYWDTWKGLAIIAVMVIHVLAALSLSPSTEIIIRQFINFPVAIFIAIAGYFSYKPEIQAVRFWQSKILRILPPYLIWTAVSILLFHRDHLENVSELLSDFFLGKGIGWGVGYFVIVLLQLVLITPLLVKIKSTSSQILTIVISLIVSMAYTYVIKIKFGSSVLASFPYSVLPFFIWLPFYQLGLMMGRGLNFKFNNPLLVALYLLFVIVSIAEGLLLQKMGYGFGNSQVKITTFLASGTLFLLAVSYQFINVKKNLLSWMGENSYPIYLIHTIVIALASNYSIFAYSKAISASLLLVMVIAGTALIVLVLNKLLHGNFKQKILG